MIALPHICLRCQLRLARRAPSRVQAAFHSSSAHSTNLPNQPSRANGEHETMKQPFIKPEYLHQTNFSHRPLETQSALQRLHGQNGKKLREDRERLDIDALGKPADVIVLRDSKISTYSHVKVIELDEEPQSIDILATLDSERGLPGQQEIVENINQFRPKEGEEPQDWDAFNSLVTDIQSSFTASQLGRYIQSFTKSHGEDQSSQRDRQLIPRISSWTPKKSHASQCSDDSYTRGYSLASYTNKQILAFRILQECWKVELDETVGEVELELKSKDYALLLRGSRPILGVIAAEYINREDERIDGFRSKHIIRITSTRRKSELIINEIERTLRNIRQEEIYLGDLARPGSSRNRMWNWIDTQFNSSTIKFLSDLTNTEIDVLPKKRLRISCIDTKPGSVKGNRVDIVLRYLVTSENISNRITNWLGCRETAKASSGVFMAFTAIEGLGWRDRLRQWTRWTAPIAKKADPQDVPQQDVPQHSSTTLEQSANVLTASPKINVEPQSVDVGQELVANAILQSQNSQTGGNSMSKNAHDGSLHWEDRYRIESSALIGCVLHSYADAAKPSAMASLPIGKASKSQMHRTFSTAVPNLSKLFGSTSMQDVRRVGPHRTLIMNFQPNPFFKSRETSQSIGAAALSAFPPLEMRFSINEDNNSYILRDIQAIVSVRNSDFMLPESVSDVRFQQRTVSTLVVRPEHYPPSLAKFLSDSSLDIEHGYFDAPPKLTIPIAAHLCQGSGFDLLGGDKAGADMQDVEYLFTGLDIRKRVMMSWEGWRLHYTSIEAGKAGGRRGELRLIPVRLDSVSTAATEEEFLESACRLADGAEGGGVEQSVVRAVHMPKPVRKIWTDGGRAGAHHKIPRFFAKRVDIRHPEVQESETMHMANMQELSEHLAELEEKESRFGKEGDEDEFA